MNFAMEEDVNSNRGLIYLDGERTDDGPPSRFRSSEFSSIIKILSLFIFYHTFNRISDQLTRFSFPNSSRFVLKFYY